MMTDRGVMPRRQQAGGREEDGAVRFSPEKIPLFLRGMVGGGGGGGGGGGKLRLVKALLRVPD